MNGRNPHSALKFEMIANASRNHLEVAVVRLRWGKHDKRCSVHVYPSSYSVSPGLQSTDFLAYLGFSRNDACPFTSGRACYVKWVDEGFDPDQFITVFLTAFKKLEAAEQGLQSCGFKLSQPEGLGFFLGKPSSGTALEPAELVGDGHTAHTSNNMKQKEDAHFYFQFSFIETDYGKGFVTHYRPKHPPLSVEIRSVFQYFGLREFPECPEYDFEPCFYRTLKYESRGDSYFDNNTEYAHSRFDAHEQKFSSAIQALLAVNAEIESSGMSFLPFSGNPIERLDNEIESRIIRPQSTAEEIALTSIANESSVPSKFDVAISVAGTDKEHARDLAKKVKAAGFAVFYYEFYPEYLWGKDLAMTFDEIFRKRSRFCVLFVSKDYRDRVWTIHEMRSALSRAVIEKGKEYILPIRLDETELEGLLPTIGYLPIGMGIDKIGDLLVSKLAT